MTTEGDEQCINSSDDDKKLIKGGDSDFSYSNKSWKKGNISYKLKNDFNEIIRLMV